MSDRPTTKEPSHPLVGAGLHYKSRDGCVENQAEIIAIIPGGGTSPDLALIQFFDWIVGHASTRRLVSLAAIAATDQWVLYPSVEVMNDHYERVDQHQNEHIRRAREKDAEARAALTEEYYETTRDNIRA